MGVRHHCAAIGWLHGGAEPLSIEIFPDLHFIPDQL